MTEDQLRIIQCVDQMETALVDWTDSNVESFLNMSEVVGGLASHGSVVDSFAMIGIAKVAHLLIERKQQQEVSGS